MSNNQQAAFILVFRPHQRSAWAEGFECDDEFVRGWRNGCYDRSCSANFDLTDKEQEPTYENAIRDCQHDLHCITRLDSPAEFEQYVESRQHNMAISDVFKEAKRLGWICEFPFATDSESGELTATSFEDAKKQLQEMVTPACVADGAWGWVENVDGDRYEIGNVTE